MVDFKALAAPFPPEKIHWRVGSTNQDKTRGLALAYLDARDVMDRLDQVCGPAGWQCRYSHVGDKVACEIGIRLGYNSLAGLTSTVATEWVFKADGAGDTDFEGAKGSFSGAFKRAAVRWGIGRYLYDLPAEWVAIEERGRSYAIKPSALKELHRRIGFTGEPRDISHGSGSLPAEDEHFEMFDPYGELEDTIAGPLSYLGTLTQKMTSVGAYWPSNRHVVEDIWTKYKDYRPQAEKTANFGKECWAQSPDNKEKKSV